MHPIQLNVVTICVAHVLEIDLLSVRHVDEGNEAVEPKTVPVLRVGSVKLGLVCHVITKGVFLALCFYDRNGFVINK